jgi:hypothetical protein
VTFGIDIVGASFTKRSFALALSEPACGRWVDVAGADHRVPLALSAIVPEVASFLWAHGSAVRVGPGEAVSMASRL